MYLRKMDTQKAIDHLLARRQINEITGCWIWTGPVMPYNYGSTVFEKKSWATHRLSYTAFKGPIPDKMLCRHRCDNPRCFNPEHLILGTPSQNNMDCVRAGRHAEASKTHCKWGHEFTPENTKVAPRGRICRACEKRNRRTKRAPVRPDKLTHCKRGHERSPENTYKEPNGRGGTKCRPCMRARLTERRRVILKLMKENPEQVGFRTE